jgi:hypothetical protein
MHVCQSGNSGLGGLSRRSLEFVIMLGVIVPFIDGIVCPDHLETSIVEYYRRLTGLQLFTTSGKYNALDSNNFMLLQTSICLGGPW